MNHLTLKITATTTFLAIMSAHADTTPPKSFSEYEKMQSTRVTAAPIAVQALPSTPETKQRNELVVTGYRSVDGAQSLDVALGTKTLDGLTVGRAFEGWKLMQLDDVTAVFSSPQGVRAMKYREPLSKPPAQRLPMIPMMQGMVPSINGIAPPIPVTPN